jgi:hypothetical protein
MKKEQRERGWVGLGGGDKKKTDEHKQKKEKQNSPTMPPAASATRPVASARCASRQGGPPPPPLRPALPHRRPGGAVQPTHGAAPPRAPIGGGFVPRHRRAPSLPPPSSTPIAITGGGDGAGGRLPPRGGAGKSTGEADDGNDWDDASQDGVSATATKIVARVSGGEVWVGVWCTVRA